MKRYLLLILALLSMPILATIINPVPIDKQLKSAYAVIYGKYMGKVYKLDQKGEVVTDHSFQLLRSVGLTPNEIINKNDFRVTSPGGSWQGISYVVHSAPQFSPGDEVVLIINRGKEGGFVFQNLSLGKYEIHKKGDELYLSSALFPHHPQLGTIRYEDFNNSVETAFGQKLTLLDDREIHIVKDLGPQIEKSKKRKPASDFEEEPASFVSEQSQYRIAMFWLVFILASSGAVRAFFMKKKNR